ncbi:MAG: thiol protease/hemagglutinin PrtT [Bacteroidia bacterium]|nr:thiol protease/hemagglutinin PrtT [Bacteroidia bacterium]
MKKLLLSFFSICLFSSPLFAKHVDIETARNVGQGFIAKYSKTPERRETPTLSLSSKPTYEINQTTHTLYYIFNVNSTGFIIVAGDDKITPIIAYSNEVTFNPSNIPFSVKAWLEEYNEQIKNILYNNIPSNPQIEQEWQIYSGSGVQPTAPAGATATKVDPLVKTKWNQRPYVNDMCPGGSVTGCVATAMAQVLKFWNYPPTGTGFHSYNHKSYGSLSANFGSRTYQWDSMPNLVNSPNNAVATLMYDCGVSVNMNYSPSSSGAYVITSQSPVQNCTEYALRNYFDYKSSLQGVVRSSYSEAQWIAALKKELDEGRPIIYAGFGSGGGHCFICDGYDEAGLFHFNWGWGGSYDGYFSINALNPSGVGTGGGTGGFNSGHQAILGVEPTDGTGLNKNTRLELNAVITAPDTAIWFKSQFQVSVSIKNFGISNFSGKLGAAIFDKNMQFLSFIDTTVASIKNDSSFATLFKNKGSAAYVPGNYIVQIFYKKTDGGWSIVGDSLFANSAQIQFKFSSDEIETNSNFVITGDKLVLSESANIAVSVKNSSDFATFVGTYRISLSNLDGSLAQTIGSSTESGVFPDANRNLNISGIISVPPGTYLMDVSYKYQGSPQWYYAGSTNFSNPIYVKVISPILSPDKYENNDSIGAAYLLPVTFSGLTAKVKSSESNIHIGTDNDFYKIKLPAGNNYTVKARLQDSYSSDDGNDYYVDALFSYSLDSITWTETYDDVMPGQIVLDNNQGGTIYFHVAPYFEGENGTYLLDITVEKDDKSSVLAILADGMVNLYPNPANSYIVVDVSQYPENIDKIEIWDLTGKLISQTTVNGSNRLIEIPTLHIPNGIYLIQTSSQHYIDTKRLVIFKD